MRTGRHGIWSPKHVWDTRMRMRNAYCTICVWAIPYAYGPSRTRMGHPVCVWAIPYAMGQNIHMVCNTTNITSQK